MASSRLQQDTYKATMSGGGWVGVSGWSEGRGRRGRGGREGGRGGEGGEGGREGGGV